MGRHVGPKALRVCAPMAVIGCLFCGLLIAPIASAQSPAGTAAKTSYGPVGAKETLWAIAKSLTPTRPGVTTAQMAWALYRANPTAFEGAPGRIKARTTLTIPDTATIKSVDTKLAYGYVMGKPTPPTQTAAATPKPVVPAPAMPVPMSADDELSKFVLNPELAAAIQPAVAAAAFKGSADARSLPAEAGARYQTMMGLEERYAGDVDFDYLYGTTAYDSGHYSEAIFILQRVVSLKPGFSGARMELARAYYATGDNESARREFLTVREENPPPEAKRVIADYLNAIDRRAARYESQLAGFLEGSTGFDTNANGGPDTQTFLGFTLDSRNQATESAYYGLGLGGSLSYPFAPGWRAVGDTRLQHRAYPDAPFVDGDLARLGAGLEWKPGVVTLSLLPNFSVVRLDGQDNHQNTAVDFSTGYAPTERWLLSFSTRYAMLRFVDELATQDVNSLLAGLSALRSWSGLPRLQLGATLTAGQDDPQDLASQFGRDMIGMRLSGNLDFNRGRVLFLSLANLDSNYDGVFFGMPRKDQQFSATLGLDWGVYRASGWLLRGQMSYVDNSSDVSLYDYNRVDAGLSLRKEFK